MLPIKRTGNCHLFRLVAMIDAWLFSVPSYQSLPFPFPFPFFLPFKNFTCADLHNLCAAFATSCVHYVPLVSHVKWNLNLTRDCREICRKVMLNTHTANFCCSCHDTKHEHMTSFSFQMPKIQIILSKFQHIFQMVLFTFNGIPKAFKLIKPATEYKI